MTPLQYSRLAMVTLTPQDYIVHNDGALYSPQMLKLFEMAMREASAPPEKGNAHE